MAYEIYLGKQYSDHLTKGGWAIQAHDICGLGFMPKKLKQRTKLKYKTWLINDINNSPYTATVINNIINKLRCNDIVLYCSKCTSDVCHHCITIKEYIDALRKLKELIE